MPWCPHDGASIGDDRMTQTTDREMGVHCYDARSPRGMSLMSCGGLLVDCKGKILAFVVVDLHGWLTPMGDGYEIRRRHHWGWFGWMCPGYSPVRRLTALGAAPGGWPGLSGSTHLPDELKYDCHQAAQAGASQLVVPRASHPQQLKPIPVRGKWSAAPVPSIIRSFCVALRRITMAGQRWGTTNGAIGPFSTY